MSKGHHHHLMADQKYKLMKLVEAKYTEARQSDTTFAETASKELGFHVTVHNVAGARTALNIPNTRETLKSEEGSEQTLLKRVRDLEDTVARMQESFRALSEVVARLMGGKE